MVIKNVKSKPYYMNLIYINAAHINPINFYQGVVPIVKKTSFIFLLILFWANLKAQDLIIKNDKTEIKSKVLEITDTQIKYKKFEMLDGPTYNINKVDVFLIIYKNGLKEYIDNSVKKPQQNLGAQMVGIAQAMPANTTQLNSASKTDTVQKIFDPSLSFAINDGGTLYDIEYTYFGAGNRHGKLGLGIDFYHTFSGTPGSGGTFIFFAYKYSFGKTHDFSVWGNLGYNLSYVSSYYDSNYNRISGTHNYSSLWELGVSVYFSKHVGVTAYTSQGTSEWFGIVFR